MHLDMSASQSQNMVNPLQKCIAAVPLSSSEMNLHSACAVWDFRENWGKEKATVRLQAFLELAVGEERLKAAQDIVKAKVTYK